MGKLASLKGFLYTFWSMVKEDWNELDHKLIRVLSAIIGFALVAVFWFYFFRRIAPWPF
jgi:hypothetical protein